MLCSCAPTARATTTTSGCSPSAIARRRRPHSPGLYHLAWQVDTIDDLAAVRPRAQPAGALVGESDHGVMQEPVRQRPGRHRVRGHVAGAGGSLGRLRRQDADGPDSTSTPRSRAGQRSTPPTGRIAQRPSRRAQRALEVGVGELVAVGRAARSGRTRWPARRAARRPVRRPSSSFGPNAGTGRNVGRCSTSPSVSANSALVTGSGAVRLTATRHLARQQVDDRPDLVVAGRSSSYH